MDTNKFFDSLNAFNASLEEGRKNKNKKQREKKRAKKQLRKERKSAQDSPGDEDASRGRKGYKLKSGQETGGKITGKPGKSKAGQGFSRGARSEVGSKKTLKTVQQRAERARQNDDVKYKKVKKADGSWEKKPVGLPTKKVDLHRKDQKASAYGEKEGNPWHGTDGKFSKQGKVASGRGTFSLRGVKRVPKAAVKGQGGRARLGATAPDCGRDARGHAVGYKHGTRSAKYPDRVKKYRGDLRCWDKKLLSPDPASAKEKGLDVSGAGQRQAARKARGKLAKLGQTAAAGRTIKAKRDERDSAGKKTGKKVDVEYTPGTAGAFSKRRELMDKQRAKNFKGLKLKKKHLAKLDKAAGGDDPLSGKSGDVKTRQRIRKKTASAIKGERTVRAKAAGSAEKFRSKYIVGKGKSGQAKNRRPEGK